MQTLCNYECAIEYAKQSEEKRRKKKKTENRKAIKEFNNQDKKVLKELAQKLANKYGRLRDLYHNGHRCCTCSNTGKMDGGHFLPTSGYSAIRYNVNQIHQQCVPCNRYNGGRPKEYRVFMVDKYGEDYVQQLESNKGVLRSYSEEYYQRFIKIARKKINRIEKKLQ